MPFAHDVDGYEGSRADACGCVDGLNGDLDGSGGGIHHGCDLTDAAGEAELGSGCRGDPHLATFLELVDIAFWEIDASHKRIIIGHCEEFVARPEMLTEGDEAFGDAGGERSPDDGLGQPPFGFGNLLHGNLMVHLELVEGLGRDQTLLEAVLGPEEGGAGVGGLELNLGFGDSRLVLDQDREHLALFHQIALFNIEALDPSLGFGEDLDLILGHEVGGGGDI